jgi:hypothetical protein
MTQLTLRSERSGVGDTQCRTAEVIPLQAGVVTFVAKDEVCSLQTRQHRFTAIRGLYRGHEAAAAREACALNHNRFHRLKIIPDGLSYSRE